MNLLKLLLAFLSVTGLSLLGLGSGALQAARGFVDRLGRDSVKKPVPPVPVTEVEQVLERSEHWTHRDEHHEDEVQHRHWWGHHDEHNNGDPRGRFHFAMKNKMIAVRECHMRCGADRACHEQCPRPWAVFERKCAEYEPIAKCHFSCWKARGGIACHKRCPQPKCPWMARRMQAAQACHHGCGHGNFKCHMSCPRPLVKLVRKCHRLEEVIKCHRQCGHGDRACHHGCPKLRPLWHHGSTKAKEFARFQAKMHGLKEVLV